jgi:phytoene dehydrogenase-like protein
MKGSAKLRLAKLWALDYAAAVRHINPCPVGEGGDRMVEKSIIIIGAGLAGLSAGCYGQMNGYRTLIFEMHDRAGGVCTGWQRKGYTIDSAMHWLAGTKPETSFYKFWEELGAAQQWQVFDHDQFNLIEDESGRVFALYSDTDRLEQQMMEFAPEDEAIIREFTKAIRDCGRFDMPVEKPPELYGLIDGIKMTKMLPYLMFVRRWGKISTGDYARRFKNPFLREVFNMSGGGEFANAPVLDMTMALAWQHQRAAGYVIGGALALVSYIQQRYLDLGGELHLEARVEKIVVQNDRAVGIRLADGTEHRGDIVISAADGHTTIFGMLDGKYIDNKIRGDYDNLQLFSPLVHIGLGVARRFDDVPPSVTGLIFPLEKPVIIAGKERNILGVLVRNFDPTLAPEGKTVIKILFNTDYAYWERLYRDPERYKAEKEQIADTVVTLLDERFPGLAAQVEMRDVATPMTWVRYTGNWKGSYRGWLRTTETFMMQMSKTLPGLGGFYMAGQWVTPGGSMPAAVISARHTMQIICKRDQKRFTTTVP